MSPIEFAQRHVSLIAAQDLDGLVDLYADDAVLVSLEWTAEGRDAIRERFASFLAYHGEVASVEIENSNEAGGGAFVLFKMESERGTFRLVNVYDVEGERCTRHFSNETDVRMAASEVQKEAA